MKCPRCDDVELSTVALGKTPVDLCPQCKGIWFDRGELQAALELEPEELRASEIAPALEPAPERNEQPSESSGLPCPRCGEDLYRFRYLISSRVVVDGCEEHGLWVDGGELPQIVEWAAQMSRELTPEEQARVEAALSQVRMDMESENEAFIDGLVGMKDRKGADRAVGRLMAGIYRFFMGKFL